MHREDEDVFIEARCDTDEELAMKLVLNATVLMILLADAKSINTVESRNIV